jgi:murein DD-endopeptidase MepM/ murein hydrolase activator NlpD
MATIINSSLNADGAGEPTRAGSSEADRAQVRALAVQFESMLLSQMLREMRESMAEDDTEGLGAPMMADQMNSELGLALSKSGGIGLTNFLLQALQRDDQPPFAAASDTHGGEPALMPLASAVTVPAVLAGSPVDPSVISSDYGWRSDPIDGRARFHAGRDLRVAYGQQVRAATGGVIKSAGEQSGYGLTIVIDHGQGLETRYAHLSSIEVLRGANVVPGQAIARSGNSGRTTGPHLHFEIRQDGQPIDPGSVPGLAPVADLDGPERH